MRALHILVKTAFLAVMGTLVSCYENVIDETIVNNPQEDKFEVVQITNQINLQELPENVDLNDLTIVSFRGESSVDGSGSSQVETFNGSVPQTILLLDEKGDVVMMSRETFNEGVNNQMSVHSTAVAIVTQHPALSGVKGAAYNYLVKSVTECSAFENLEAAVANAIRDGQSIFDPNNESLTTAMNQVFEQVISGDDGSDGELPNIALQDGLYSTLSTKAGGTTSIVGLNPGPFNISTNVFRLLISNTQCSPFYSGKVTHHDKVDKLDIPSGENWGISYLWDKYVMNQSPNQVVEYGFVLNGEYQFHFSRVTLEATGDTMARILASCFEWFGVAPSLSKTITNDCVRFMTMRGLDIVQMLTDRSSAKPQDIFEIVSDAIVDYFAEGHCLRFLREQGDEKLIQLLKLENATFIKNLNLLWKAYSVTNGVVNIAMRIKAGLDMPSDVSFGLYYYDGEISALTKADIEKFSGDCQKGPIGDRLNKEITVKVTTTPAEDDTQLPPSNYHKVKFEALEKSGYACSNIVDVDPDGYARTYWKLDEENTETQYLRAVVIDIVTGEEISKEVIFEATPTVRAEVIFTLDWQPSESKCDLDLHVVDPAGHHLYFWNRGCSCVGYLDRDDTYGPGPEHIYFTDAKPGNYNVYVHHYASATRGNVGFSLTTNYNERTYVNRSSAAYDQVVYVGTLVVDDNATKSPETYFYYDENAPVLSTADIPRKNEQ